MSSGQKHSGITLGLSGGIAAGAISSYFLSTADISVMAFCCLIGIFISPDADVDAGYISFKYIRNTFGKVIGKLWWWLWTPYRVSIKHRSFWSHTPIIGTFIRLLYLVFPAIIILLPIKDQRPNIAKLIPQSLLAQIIAIPFVLLAIGFYFLAINYPEIQWNSLLLSGFIGISIADFGHYLADL